MRRGAFPGQDGHPARSGRHPRRWATPALALLGAGLIGACGSNTANEAQVGEPTGNFPARASAHFPTRQTLSQTSEFTVDVTNTGTRTMPNVAVTLTNPKDGTSAQAFGTLLAAPAPGQPVLAGRSRPVWVINRGPGPCGYACETGGDGGAGTTAYTNTWALGPLSPGATRTFAWHVTAVQPGRYTVAYQVAAGLSGRARATGTSTRGAVSVRITETPPVGSINAKGQPVESAGG